LIFDRGELKLNNLGFVKIEDEESLFMKS